MEIGMASRLMHEAAGRNAAGPKRRREAGATMHGGGGAARGERAWAICSELTAYGKPD